MLFEANEGSAAAFVQLDTASSGVGDDHELRTTAEVEVNLLIKDRAAVVR